MIEFEERINWNPHTAPINLSINSSGRHSFIKQFFARRRRRGRIFHALEFLKLFRLLLEFAIRLIINKVICQWPERFNGFNDLFTATLNIMKNYATENSPTRFVFFIRRAQFDGPKQIFKRKINIFYARSLIVHYLLWWKQTRGKRCTINAFYEMTLIIKLTWNVDESFSINGNPLRCLPCSAVNFNIKALFYKQEEIISITARNANRI